MYKMDKKMTVLFTLQAAVALYQLHYEMSKLNKRN